MKIRNKNSGIVLYASICYRKGAKCAKFSGVTMKIESTNFKKNWQIL